MGNYLPADSFGRLIRAAMVGIPQRKAAYILSVDRKTIARNTRLLGRTAILLQEEEAPQPWRRIHVDEFYTYILAKPDEAENVKSEVEVCGRALHFLAVDADSGFIVASLVAPTNDEKQTAEFLKRLDAKLARKPDGSYVRVPEVISDGHGSYEAVITEKYPSWRYAKIIKQQTNTTKDGQVLKKRIFGGHRRKVIQGAIEDYETFVNNRVEGANSAARDQNMRVHNKSKAFSKRLEQHIEQFALWVYAHNHILPNTRTKMTPALKAKVDKTLRDETTLIRQMKMFGARLRDDRLFEEDYKAFGASDKPRPVVAAMIWLYHSFAQKASKLHKPSCRFCNHGAGLGGVGEVGAWLPFQTLEEAGAYAERMTPGKVTACKHCLGERARPRHGL